MTRLSFEMELLAWAYDCPAERSEQLTGTRSPAPDPDCPRCDGSGSYREDNEFASWLEDCDCLTGKAPSTEEMPL